MRAHRGALAGLALALGLPGMLAALGTERELYDRAEKVVLARVVRLDRGERPPDWRPDRRFHYQVLWTEDVKVFKGPSTGRLGYDVVMLPFRERSRYASWIHFDAPLTPSDLPEDAQVLLYLERDPVGNLRILEGPEGFFRYPGPTRMANLSAWSKARR